MNKLYLSFFSIILFTAFAAAQTEDYHKAEVSGGYSFNRVNDDGESLNFHGFDTSVTGNFSKYAGIKFNVSGHYKKFDEGGFRANLSLYNILAGIQIKNNSKERRVKPFAHLMAGIARGRFVVNVPPPLCVPPNPCRVTESDTGFSMAAGGGIDIKASKRVDIRLIQADYNPNRLGGTWQNNFRVGIGIVIH